MKKVIFAAFVFGVLIAGLAVKNSVLAGSSTGGPEDGFASSPTIGGPSA